MGKHLRLIRHWSQPSPLTRIPMHPGLTSADWPAGTDGFVGLKRCQASSTKSFTTHHLIHCFEINEYEPPVVGGLIRSTIQGGITSPNGAIMRAKIAGRENGHASEEKGATEQLHQRSDNWTGMNSGLTLIRHCAITTKNTIGEMIGANLVITLPVLGGVGGGRRMDSDTRALLDRRWQYRPTFVII